MAEYDVKTIDYLPKKLQITDISISRHADETIVRIRLNQSISGLGHTEVGVIVTSERDGWEETISHVQDHGKSVTVFGGRQALHQTSVRSFEVDGAHVELRVERLGARDPNPKMRGFLKVDGKTIQSNVPVSDDVDGNPR